MTSTVHRTWHGDELIARARRANGRAIIGMGEQVAVRMTDVAHVISGDLRRSIHVAQRDSMGGIPADSATLAGPRLAIEVGSWLPYACVENNRGGDHRFADIGWSAAEPSFRPTLDRAWREEGL